MDNSIRYEVSSYNNGTYHLTTRHFYDNNAAYEKATGRKAENYDCITAEQVKEIVGENDLVKLNYCPEL